MITINKVLIYNKYGGDMDGIYRMGNKSDENTITGSEWSKICNFYQDVKLISDGLTSKGYVKRSIENLKRDCDREAYRYFLEKIPFSPDI